MCRKWDKNTVDTSLMECVFFVFSSAGKIEKNNLVDIAGSEVGLNFDWLKEKKNCFSVLPPVFSCVPMHNSGVRGVWQSARPRILHLSDRLYCIQTSEVKGSFSFFFFRLAK